jgi:hypothetical protein
LFSKEEKRILDNAWSEAVKERDNFLDAWDNKSPGTDPHHIFVRGSSIINRYDMRNGITLSRKNHGLAEDSKHEEFTAFVKSKLGIIYDKLEKQRSIAGIPLEYEAKFFGNFFETKKQELEEYCFKSGVQFVSKEDTVSVIEKYKNSKKIFTICENNLVYERIQSYLRMLCIEIKKRKNFLFQIDNMQILFYHQIGTTDKGFLFSLFVYELLQKELEYVFKSIY